MFFGAFGVHFVSAIPASLLVADFLDDTGVPAVAGTLAGTEYIFYCKRAILFLSSSKILTPHPPLRPAFVAGEDRLAGRRGGMGGQYFGRREK
jgi:hypothetical protein